MSYIMERFFRSFARQSCAIYRIAILAVPKSTTIRFQRFSNSTETGVPSQTDKPIAYTKSNAFTYKASENFRTTEEEISYSPHTWWILRVSLVIFLVYFCVLREPNDVDKQLSRDLFEIMPELEIPMLEVEVKRLESFGMASENIKQKLQELKKLKDQKDKISESQD